MYTNQTQNRGEPLASMGSIRYEVEERFEQYRRGKEGYTSTQTRPKVNHDKGQMPMVSNTENNRTLRSLAAKQYMMRASKQQEKINQCHD